ncbi:MAG: class I SAM-dependent methyltransferase [Verrucomicrobiales bacterium]
MAAFPRALTMAHQLIRERLEKGDSAIDATVGNGHDTLFLESCVGETGHVFGFDIQPEAIEAATKRIAEAGLENVTLSTESHADVAGHVSAPVKAAMFNLGYFPGGDKSIITRKSSTIAALKSICDLGAKIITIVVYHGHEGGDDEASAVIAWAESLDQTEFSVIRYGFINQRNAPPFLVAIERKAARKT